MERVKASRNILIKILRRWDSISGLIIIECPSIFCRIDNLEIPNAHVPLSGCPRLGEIGDSQRDHQYRQTKAEIAGEESGKSHAAASERAGRTLDAPASEVTANNRRNGKEKPETKKRYETENSEHEAPDCESGILWLWDKWRWCGHNGARGNMVSTISQPIERPFVLRPLREGYFES